MASHYGKIYAQILLLYPFLRSDRGKAARAVFCGGGQSDCRSGCLSERFLFGYALNWVEI